MKARAPCERPLCSGAENAWKGRQYNRTNHVRTAWDMLLEHMGRSHDWLRVAILGHEDKW